MRTLPSLYLSHGSPMTALVPGEAGAFFRRLGPAIEQRFGKPRAILALSSHTLTREPVLLAAAQHEAVYDFGGFDPQLCWCQSNIDHPCQLNFDQGRDAVH